MLILTEKPSVARDFAKALGNTAIITHCVGHLFELDEPVAYNPEFKSWKKLPIIPKQFHYHVTQDLKKQAKEVVELLKKHANDEILIATDADREGEIIARECLKAAGITDFSRLKRFWVSQALTPAVIQDGILKAKPLVNYNMLADQGFARQHSDWLVGMNGTRFITNKTGTLFPIGRVQTAVLAAISARCKAITKFVPHKYYEITGTFKAPDGTSVKGLFTDQNDNSRLNDEALLQKLKACLNQEAEVLDLKSEKKELLPSQLYSLNDLQKDAIKFFDYSAEKTLRLVQKLYEEYKCVSYPRTPSRVMGSQNVQLCRDLYQKFLQDYLEYLVLSPFYKIDPADKRIFNDSKLEAHHAIIPLAKLPANATGEEENLYNLILERFMLAFAPSYVYEKQTAKLGLGQYQFKVQGRTVLEEGWQKFRRFTRVLKENDADQEEIQLFDNIDWQNLTLAAVNSVQKTTKPPKHFNEASILAFMENPKGESDEKKLSGLGTPATRHTFIPKLKKSGYIEVKNKSLIITQTGEKLLELLKNTPLASLADIEETTRWEESLERDPGQFETQMKEFIKASVEETYE